MPRSRPHFLRAALAGGLAVTVLFTGAVHGQPSVPPGDSARAPESASLDQRVRGLEETVRRLEASRKEAAAADKDKEMSPDPGQDKDKKPKESSRSVVAGWDDGFFLRSEDKTFNLRITGQIQADYRAFLDGLDRTD